MLKQFRKKSGASYPILFALIMQMAITSLLCATSSYQAGAKSFMICTSFGIKTISLDENGEPVENTEHDKFGKNCFHCASGGCGVAYLKATGYDLPFMNRTREQIPAQKSLVHHVTIERPASRAPPTIL